jgi:hypothetical protein
MEYIDRRKQQIQRAIRQEREQEDWNEVHNQLLAIQRKSLAISDPKDADEQEADEVARKVVAGESAEIHHTGGTINRKGEGSFETTPEFQSKLEGSKGGGQSLDDSTKGEMESKMGADFSGVKIHTGNEAHKMSESINAKAFTHGQDIYFNQNHSPANKELLAHELVHTVQQSEGKVQPKIQRFEAPGHEAVERVGLKAAGFTNAEVSMSYFGNWMRDMNQVFVPGMLKMLSPDKVFALVGYTAYKKFGRTFTPEQFGYYIPAEHIDHPGGQVPGYDYSDKMPSVNFKYDVEDRFKTTSNEPRPANMVTPQADNNPKTAKYKGESIYSVSDDNVMVYILRTNEHIEKRLELAAQKGRNPEGMLHMSAALHAVEDLYAHSNFVEIALNMLLPDNNFLPELSEKERQVQTLAPTTSKKVPALVTGTFTSNDTFVSIGSEVVKMMREGFGPTPSKAEQKVQDAMMLQILQTFDKQMASDPKLREEVAKAIEDAGVPLVSKAMADEVRSGDLSTHDLYSKLLTIEEKISSAIGWIVPEWAKQAIRDAKNSVRAKASLALDKAANLIEAQVLEIQISETTLSQASKDQQEVIKAKGGKQSKIAEFAHDKFNAPLPTAAENLKDAQAHQNLLKDTPDYVKAGPSHSQLAKDHNDSIFHGLAFALGAEADRILGEKMLAAWGKNSVPFVDPDIALLTKKTSELNDDEKERQLVAMKRAEADLKSLNWGKHVINYGHDENVSHDLAGARKESADTVRTVALALQIAFIDLPHKTGAALALVQKYLSEADKENGFALVIGMAQKTVSLTQKGVSKVEGAVKKSSIGSTIEKLNSSAAAIEKAETLAEREAAFKELKASQQEFALWLQNVWGNESSTSYLPPLYATCLTLLNREMAIVAPAYTTEQVEALKTSSPNLMTVNIKPTAVTEKPQAIQDIINSSRKLVSHPSKDNWWQPIVKKYAEKFGSDLAQEIRARNAGYAKLPYNEKSK